MSAMYSTITSKGQITLPASLRSRLGLQPGLRVSMREVGGAIVIDPPRNMDAVRAAARQEMERAGTWGTVVPTDGWAKSAAERIGPANA
jgi:AbrB family looped-hinge helix DNA binding protein